MIALFLIAAVLGYLIASAVIEHNEAARLSVDNERLRVEIREWRSHRDWRGRR